MEGVRARSGLTRSGLVSIRAVVGLGGAAGWMGQGREALAPSGSKGERKRWRSVCDFFYRVLCSKRLGAVPHPAGCEAGPVCSVVHCW